jgi:hypothetical protein
MLRSKNHLFLKSSRLTPPFSVIRPKVAAGWNKMAHPQPEIFIRSFKMHPFAISKLVLQSQTSALNRLCAFWNKLIYIEFYGGVKKK